MITYNENDLYKYPDWLEIMKHLDLEPVEDEEIWQEARISYEIPSFENILLEKTAYRITEYLREKYPDHTFDYYINSIDSHLYCDNEEYYSIEDLLPMIGEE